MRHFFPGLQCIASGLRDQAQDRRGLTLGPYPPGDAEWADAADFIHAVLEEQDKREAVQAVVGDAVWTFADSLPRFGLWTAAVRAFHALDVQPQGLASFQMGAG